MISRHTSTPLPQTLSLWPQSFQIRSFKSDLKPPNYAVINRIYEVELFKSSRHGKIKKQTKKNKPSIIGLQHAGITALVRDQGIKGSKHQLWHLSDSLSSVFLLPILSLRSKVIKTKCLFQYPKLLLKKWLLLFLMQEHTPPSFYGLYLSAWSLQRYCSVNSASLKDLLCCTTLKKR